MWKFLSGFAAHRVEEARRSVSKMAAFFAERLKTRRFARLGVSFLTGCRNPIGPDGRYLCIGSTCAKHVHSRLLSSGCTCGYTCIRRADGRPYERYLTDSGTCARSRHGLFLAGSPSAGQTPASIHEGGFNALPVFPTGNRRTESEYKGSESQASGSFGAARCCAAVSDRTINARRWRRRWCRSPKALDGPGLGRAVGEHPSVVVRQWTSVDERRLCGVRSSASIGPSYYNKFWGRRQP